MATATRPPPVNREYYAEPTQACPLTTGDLGHPLHISTFRTYFKCAAAHLHYLGCKQKLRHAVNDNLGLEDV